MKSRKRGSTYRSCRAMPTFRQVRPDVPAQIDDGRTRHDINNIIVYRQAFGS
jgi:hypothetical protein